MEAWRNTNCWTCLRLRIHLRLQKIDVHHRIVEMLHELGQLLAVRFRERAALNHQRLLDGVDARRDGRGLLGRNGCKMYLRKKRWLGLDNNRASTHPRNVHDVLMCPATMRVCCDGVGVLLAGQS